MLLTIGPGGCGFSFLNWSLMFLRGDEFYQTLDGQQRSVTSNPLSNSTAHNYKKDHLRIEDSTSNFDHATEHSIIYAVPGNQNNFEYLLSFPGKKIVFDTTDYSKVLMARSIVCMPNNQYCALIEQLGQKYDTLIIREVLLECHKLFTQYYKIPEDSQSLYKINYHDIFSCLDQKIFELFDYLEIKINTNRLQHWQTVYAEYRQANQRDYCAEVVPSHSDNTTQKTQVLKEILKWRSGLFRNT